MTIELDEYEVMDCLQFLHQLEGYEIPDHYFLDGGCYDDAEEILNSWEIK